MALWTLKVADPCIRGTGVSGVTGCSGKIVNKSA